MRFVQILSFHPIYVASWYARNPHLAAAPYQEQLNALLDDGFLGAHYFAEALRRTGCDAHTIIANCTQLQSAWALENGVRLSARFSCADVVRLQVATLRPDILFVSDPISFDSALIRSLSKRPSFVAGWPSAGISPWSDFTEFDLIISSDPHTRSVALKHGARATEHFLPAFPGWIAEAVRDEPKMHDVVLCGQLTNGQRAGVEFVEQLSFYAKNTGDFTPALFLDISGSLDIHYTERYLQPPRWGMDLYREIRRSRIGINYTIDVAKGECVNMREFEVTGSGTMLLTQNHPDLSRRFSPGTEVETYDSFEELVEKINYYNAHEKEREQIARRGQERCLREHGLMTRAEELVERLRSFVGDIGITTRPPPAPADELVARSIQLIQDNSVEDSYRAALQALRHYPEARFVHYILGLGLLKMERVPEACQALAKELELYPDSPHALELISRVQQALSTPVN
jgi:tetratricopeptide (TPR) repeat protein